jgi:adenylosuccinate synthase
VVIDPAALLEEIAALEAAGIQVQGHLAVSNRAHVIFPVHRLVEKMSEARPDRVAIGTTSRGIGPCYEDKTGRRGIRMADLIDRKNFAGLLGSLTEDKETLARAFNLHETADSAKVRQQYEEYAERLRPLVCDTAMLLNRAIGEGKRLLFEGAQGTMLDIDHGTYPFVTSSSAAAGGASTGSGVPPTRINGVIGVSKAYTTRVGSGPFPTEERGETGEMLRRAGKEYGAVTGRPRRCGWFDVPLLRYTAAINGFDSLIITKLDVLDSLEEIPVGVAYRSGGKEITDMPATRDGLDHLETVCDKMPGWGVSTTGTKEFANLPQRAKEYLQFLSERTGVEIGCVSIGPDRDQTLFVPGSRLEKLLG